MKTTLILVTTAVALTGCVGTDVMSSVTPATANTQFGYPKIEQAALPVLPSPSAPAAPAHALSTPVASASLRPPRPAIAPAPMPAETVYDESRDPAFASLLADANTAEGMPDLPLTSNGTMRLPPSPELEIINIDDTRTSLQASE